ncbi:MAG TPA: hypothetical protein VM694_41970, partial [Polyangium sp.]|nr:hypothetical protein [Polyangium sp.]
SEPLTCGADCVGFCGDGVCQPFETCLDCLQDCGACTGTCGDGTCTAKSENQCTCPADCGGKCPP